MGTGRTQSTTPDLFSTASIRETSSPSADQPTSPPQRTDAAKTAPSPRLLLPKDLPNAIKKLSDQELDQLSAAVLVERQRRGSNPPSNENTQKRRVEEVSAPLSVGKLNAVRAAFKVGLKPSQIARQFRISQSNVRKALARDESRKGSEQ
jgi:hypothetical protein